MCSINKKGHIPVNLGQLEEQQYANLKFGDSENVKKNKKGYCMRVPLAISV